MESSKTDFLCTLVDPCALLSLSQGCHEWLGAGNFPGNKEHESQLLSVEIEEK